MKTIIFSGAALIVIAVLVLRHIKNQNRLIDELLVGLYPFTQPPHKDLEFYYNKADRLYRRSRGK